MTRQNIIIFILTFHVVFSFGLIKGQTCTSFLALDKKINSEVPLLEFKTNKILFLSNGDIDTVASKIYLDSLVWFLNKHGQTGIKITMDKTNAVRYDLSENANKHTMQLANYVIARGVLEIRFPIYYIDDAVLYHEESNAKDKTIWTKITFYNNFVDPSATYLKDSKPLESGCAVINTHTIQLKNTGHNAWLFNDAEIDGKSKSEITMFFGPPTILLSTNYGNQMETWHYYIKYCDKNSYKDSYVMISFLKNNATKTLILRH